MSGHLPNVIGIFLLEWQAEADFARNTTSRRNIILFSEVAAVTLWLKSLLHNAIHFLGVRFWHCCQGQHEELEFDVVIMGTGDAFSVVILSRTSGECLV